MNPKRFLLCLLLLYPLTAWAGSTVTVGTRAANLLPGTKVRVEIGAAYRMHELPKRPANSTERVLRVPVSDDLLRYDATAANRGLWQFTIPPSGSAPGPMMELRWDKNFPKTPAGMSSRLYFDVRYTLDVPEHDGKKGRTVSRTIETSLRVPEEGAPVGACLRFEKLGDGVFVGVTPACDTPLFRSRVGGKP